MFTPLIGTENSFLGGIVLAYSGSGGGSGILTLALLGVGT